MKISGHLQHAVADAIQTLFGESIDPDTVIVQPTRKEFEGDYTVVIFPFVKKLRKSPADLGQVLGEYLVSSDESVSTFTVVQGFLNLSLSDTYWLNLLVSLGKSNDWWKPTQRSGRALVEFSSPNTNKPLHLGHIRNILLGWSMSRILEQLGHEVIKVQIVNDRGIAICKSMLAWKLFGEGKTPSDTGIKADHYVGQWYVRFDQELGKEYAAWQETKEAEGIAAGAEERDVFFKKYKNKYFNEHSKLGAQARDLLLKWEAEDPEVRALWSQMNGWVYEGFEETYERMGVSFDKLYYESNTYVLGREMVQQGLDQDVFYKEEDGSVWVDLEPRGLDKKILLRSDGTSVYLTQDLGTAQLRYNDFGTERMIYVVGDEQNYHFKVLFECLKLLGVPFADGLFHLSYGMVDLPEGRMKSREGTVVDADDLMDEVYKEAEAMSAERGELTDIDKKEQEEILRQVSLAALKFFIIKVEPKRRMTFNPAESVDMQGQTGPYIQNAYVRIQSIKRKAGIVEGPADGYELNGSERDLLRQLMEFATTIEQAADQYNPGHIANYAYQLAKTLHRYYHDYRILSAETEAARYHRLLLIEQVGEVLKTAMELLGIEMPARM